MLNECKLLYCGRSVIDKKDKNSNQKTGEQLVIYKFLDVDKSKNSADIVSFFIKPEEDVFVLADVKVLQPLMVTLDISLTSNFNKLVNIEIIK